ncbi:MAG: DUF4406 domain-containing protein [Phycisphaerales bacterium]|jgi:hypothetical protein
MIVYIAGPYTKGDVAVNVRKAIEAADKLADLGFIPYLPHLTHFWHLVFPRPYKYWLEYDKIFLKFCDCLLRLSGESSGADGEVAEARNLGKPVFYSIDDLIEYAKKGAPSHGLTESKW